MAATYDSSLGSDRDWVRFLTGDRGPTFKFTDEELDAVLTDTPGKYCAAAAVLESMRTGWVSGGVKSKSVEGLSITFNSPEDITKRIDFLRGQCASGTQPAIFRVLV